MPGPAGEAPFPAPDAWVVPVIPGQPPDRVGMSVRGFERRLEDVVTTIQEFAALRFDAPAPIGPDGDIVDAVAGGVNFLGEELEASFHEIERRAADRTAELSIATGTGDGPLDQPVSRSMDRPSPAPTARDPERGLIRFGTPP